MTICIDTNVLVRSVVRDSPTQADAANDIMSAASVVAISSSSLCEFVWVLRTVYRYATPEIASALRVILSISNIVLNRLAIEAGLTLLESGADFADGVIAYEGRWLGGATFVSFDSKAITLLSSQGHQTHLLR